MMVKEHKICQGWEENLDKKFLKVRNGSCMLFKKNFSVKEILPLSTQYDKSLIVLGMVAIMLFIQMQ